MQRSRDRSSSLTDRTTNPTLTSRKEEAISDARSKVSALQRIGTDRWAYHVWSDSQQAWLPSLRADSYAEASRKRAASISSIAAHSLLRADKVSDAEEEELVLRIIAIAYGSVSSGGIGSRVDEILRRLQQPESKELRDGNELYS